MTPTGITTGAALQYSNALLGGPTVENDSVVSVSTSIITLCNGSGDRVALIFCNLGPGDVYIAPNAAPSANLGIKLGANGGVTTMNVTQDFTFSSRQWNAICPAGGPSNVYVLELARFTYTPKPAGS